MPDRITSDLSPASASSTWVMSRGVAGPGCRYLLAAHGADAIGIEPPRGDRSAMSLAVARGKRGIALDLRNPRGREAALRTIGRADVAKRRNRDPQNGGPVFLVPE